MKVKKLLKSLFMPLSAIRIVKDKNIFNCHSTDETFEIDGFPEEYMNCKVKKFYLESYSINSNAHIILNVRI